MISKLDCLLEHTRHVLKKQDCNSEEFVNAIDSLAKMAAVNAIYVLHEDDNDSIQDFFYSLDDSLESGEEHKAVEDFYDFLKKTEQNEMMNMIHEFILDKRWEATFIEVLVEYGSDCLLFESLEEMA